MNNRMVLLELERGQVADARVWSHRVVVLPPRLDDHLRLASRSTYGGQTIHIARPSAQNTVLMVNDRSEVQGMTYDAAIVYRSLSAKYDVHK
jgi:hypothetical protein